MLVRPALREYRTWTLDSRYWDGYSPRHDDVVIASAPKCGTTWMQQIVSSLVFQDAHVRALPMVSPWVEARFRFTSDQIRDILSSLPHRRFLKTHLPVDGVPLYDQVKYIHVARDGRDAAMSTHSFFSGFSDEYLARLDAIGLDDPVIDRPFPRPPSDPAAYFRQWISAKVTRGPVEGPPSPLFLNFEIGYWAERRRSNVLLVHYADLSRDLSVEMLRIADFLEIKIDESLWSRIVHAANFETMKAAGDNLMPQTKMMLVEGSRRFFNKGVNGRWRDVLTDDDLALYDARVRETLSPSLAAWLEGGRGRSGDPRLALD
jgi:aryl sulfotransferase